jgi:HSP20 family protein
MSESSEFEKHIADLREQINQLFRESVRETEGAEPLDEAEWAPCVDILENRDDIVIKADIPGMEPDDIELFVSENILQIKGDRKHKVEREDENYHSIEREFGKFNRLIKLPTMVIVDNIKASYSNGVLTVRLPKFGDRKPEKIEVNPE